MKDNSFVVAENDGTRIFHVGYVENFNELFEGKEELVFGGTFLPYYSTRQIAFNVKDYNEDEALSVLSEMRNDVINAMTDYNLRWYYAKLDFEPYTFVSIRKPIANRIPASCDVAYKQNNQTMEEIVSYLNIGRGERWADKGNEDYKEPYTVDDDHSASKPTTLVVGRIAL